MPTGYARASTDDQSLGVQRDALRLAGCGTFCQDRISLISAQEIDTGSSGGRLAFHFRT